MKRLIISALSTVILLSLLPSLEAQQDSQTKLNPEAVKTLQNNEKRMTQMVEDSKKNPGPTFSAEDCRRDTQSWTSDPAEMWAGKNLLGGTLIIANGQSRLLPSPLTPRLPMPKLLDRIHEMTVCQTTDADFQRQFSTYSTIHRIYNEEEQFRYMKFLMDHGLFDQFIKEDAEANK